MVSCPRFCLIVLILSAVATSLRGQNLDAARLPGLQFQNAEGQPLAESIFAVCGLKPASGIWLFTEPPSRGWAPTFAGVTNAQGSINLDLCGPYHFSHEAIALNKPEISVFLLEPRGYLHLFQRSALKPGEVFRAPKDQVTELRLHHVDGRPLAGAIVQPLVVNGQTLPTPLVDSPLLLHRADDEGIVKLPMNLWFGHLRISHPLVGDGSHEIARTVPGPFKLSLPGPAPDDWIIEVASEFPAALNLGLLSNFKEPAVWQAKSWRLRLEPGSKHRVHLDPEHMFRLYVDVPGDGATLTARIDHQQKLVRLEPTQWRFCTGRFTTADLRERPQAVQVRTGIRDSFVSVTWRAAVAVDMDGEFSLPYPDRREDISFLRELDDEDWVEMSRPWPKQLPTEVEGQLQLEVTEAKPLEIHMARSVNLGGHLQAEHQDLRAWLVEVRGQIRHADGSPAAFHPVILGYSKSSRSGQLVFSNAHGHYHYGGFVEPQTITFGYSQTAITQPLDFRAKRQLNWAAANRRLVVDCQLQD